MTKYWTCIYTVCFAIALLFGRLCFFLNLHWLLISVFVGVFIFFWCWWNANWGNLPPFSNGEQITKFTVIPVAILGWIIGRIYGIG